MSKIYAILNHVRIVVQPRLQLTILYIHTADASVYFKTEYLTPDINVLGRMMSSLVSTTMPPATPATPRHPPPLPPLDPKCHYIFYDISLPKGHFGSNGEHI